MSPEVNKEVEVRFAPRITPGSQTLTKIISCIVVCGNFVYLEIKKKSHLKDGSFEASPSRIELLLSG